MYIHKPESVLENETHKILCFFEIQTDPLILNRKSDPVLINKKKRTCQVDFDILAEYRVKIKESKKDRQIFGPCQATKKVVWEMVIPLVCACLEMSPKAWKGG